MPDDPQGGYSVETWRDFERHGYSVAAHCWRCARWADIDVAQLAAAAEAGLRSPLAIGARYRCRQCGGAGQAVVQPPGVPYTRDFRPR